MLKMMYPETRRIAESAVKMMATDVLVDDAIATGVIDADDDSAVNNFWFQTKSTLSLDEAVSLLEDRGLATFEVR
jgi:hypothetical protein